MTKASREVPAKAPGTKCREFRLRYWLAAAVLLAALTLAVAACGGGGSSSASGTTSGGASSEGTSKADSAQQSGIAYAQCMRAHGVSNYPDNAISSNGNGTEVKLPAGITSEPNYSSASKDCQSKLPNGGNTSGSANNSRVQAEIKWADCMRSHGVTNAPEPNSKGAIIMGGSSGVDPNSPTFQSAMRACRKDLPNGGSGVGA